MARKLEVKGASSLTVTISLDLPPQQRLRLNLDEEGKRPILLPPCSAKPFCRSSQIGADHAGREQTVSSAIEHFLVLRDYRYATLDGVDPNAAFVSGQRESLLVPSDWEFMHAEAISSSNLEALLSFPWGCSFLVFADGQAPQTSAATVDDLAYVANHLSAAGCRLQTICGRPQKYKPVEERSRIVVRQPLVPSVKKIPLSLEAPADASRPQKATLTVPGGCIFLHGPEPTEARWHRPGEERQQRLQS